MIQGEPPEVCTYRQQGDSPFLRQATTATIHFTLNDEGANQMSVFLGIDIGTSGTKTLAIDPEGTILASAMETYPCYVPKPMWSEQDPEDWWQGTIRSVRCVMEKAGLKPGEVKAIGLSGQMHGSVFLDKQDKVLRRAILWNDQRTKAECEEMEDRVGGQGTHQAGGQSGDDGVHGPQDSLAAEP